MTDRPEREAPTAEEIAIELERKRFQPFLRSLDQDQLRQFQEIMRLCAGSERAAVEAERERACSVALHKCRTIGIIRLFHDGMADEAGKEIAAAIRKGPTDD